ncbi:PIG-M-domain-containing protein, partial [Amylostereum chailletii]
PLLALLLAPNEWIHPSFGKYLFAGCDILAGILMHSLLVSVLLPRGVHASLPAPEGVSPVTENPDAVNKTSDRPIAAWPSSHDRATFLASLHLFSPFVFSISTRGSSESVLLLFVLATLFCALRQRWDRTAVLLGLSVHWKIYPVIYGVACVSVLGAEQRPGKRNNADVPAPHSWLARAVRYLGRYFNIQTIRFAGISAGTFLALGVAMYAIWGYPFLHETYLYHLHRRDHRHNFSPYFYLIYLTYPGAAPTVPNAQAQAWHGLLRSPLVSFLPQMILALGSGAMLARKKDDLILAWFVQTTTFVIFNKVCTSQYFLWYLLFIPLLVPRLSISAPRAAALAAVWLGTQMVWLSQAYRLEFLGDAVFLPLWACGLMYVLGHVWVLGEILDGYVTTS